MLEERFVEDPYKVHAKVVHRQFGAQTSFDHEGIHIKRWPKTSVTLAWSEIDFVCLTPTMERTETGWTQKYNKYLTNGFQSTLVSSGILHIAIVVFDRRPIIARSPNFWTRSWVGSSLRRMLDGHDNYKEDQSNLQLEIYRHRLDHSLDDLLDLIASNARFDLVIFDF